MKRGWGRQAWDRLGRTLLAATLLVGLTVLAPTHSVQAAPVRDRLILGLPLEPPNLDPTSGAAAAVDEVVYGNIFEGLTKLTQNGAVPMGAVGVRGEIYDAVVNQAAAPGIEFFHGYTYSGHPLAAAAGLATLDVYESEGLFQRATDMAPYWQEAVHSLKSLPNVIDIRNLGMVAAVELAPRPDAPGARATEVFHRAFDEGLLIRVTGDVIALSPPLIISHEQIDELVGRLAAILRNTP